MVLCLSSGLTGQTEEMAGTEERMKHVQSTRKPITVTRLPVKWLKRNIRELWYLVVQFLISVGLEMNLVGQEKQTGHPILWTKRLIIHRTNGVWKTVPSGCRENVTCQSVRDGFIIIVKTIKCVQFPTWLIYITGALVTMPISCWISQSHLLDRFILSILPVQ